MYSADIVSFLNVNRIKTTIQKFISYHDENRLQVFIGDYDNNKIQLLRNLLEVNDLTNLLEELHIHLLLGDIKIGRIPEKVQLIHSNNTFEHIPARDLAAILHFFHTAIAPSGVMSHFIDMSDHFSHLDTAITSFNFLQYSSRSWKRIDNSIQPQNRMRIAQYRNLFFEAGWAIALEENVTGSEADLDSIKLSAEFASMVRDEVRVTHSWIVAVAK